jgi:hypothetical protein
VAKPVKAEKTVSKPKSVNRKSQPVKKVAKDSKRAPKVAKPAIKASKAARAVDKSQGKRSPAKEMSKGTKALIISVTGKRGAKKATIEKFAAKHGGKATKRMRKH